MRVAVRPGQGLVARFEKSLLVILKDVSSPTAAALIEACRSDPAPADRLRSLSEGEHADPPTFFALVEEGSQIHLCVSGAMTVALKLEGSQLDFASTDPRGWIEEALRGRLIGLTVGGRSGKAEQTLADLERGVVLGAGLDMAPRSSAAAATVVPKPKAPAAAPPPEPAPPEPARPEPAPAAAEPVVVDEAHPDHTVKMPPVEALTEAQAGLAGVDFQGSETVAVASPSLEPATEAGPAQMVTGKACADGHLNDPLAPACRVCGAPLLDAYVQGPRPILGRLVGDDGLEVVLDRDYLVGRGPDAAIEVKDGSHTPVVVPPGMTAVSRVHLELRISEWAVLVSDRSSANGTFLRPVGLEDWIRLDPGHAVQIVPGSAIRLGPYELRFEA